MNERALCRIVIPENLDFSDLQLARDSDGAVSFAWEVIEDQAGSPSYPPGRA